MKERVLDKQLQAVQDAQAATDAVEIDLKEAKEALKFKRKANNGALLVAATASRYKVELHVSKNEMSHEDALAFGKWLVATLEGG